MSRERPILSDDGSNEQLSKWLLGAGFAIMLSVIGWSLSLIGDVLKDVGSLRIDYTEQRGELKLLRTTIINSFETSKQLQQARLSDLLARIESLESQLAVAENTTRVAEQTAALVRQHASNFRTIWPRLRALDKNAAILAVALEKAGQPVRLHEPQWVSPGDNSDRGAPR